MTSLAEHFGEDASLDGPTTRHLASWLVDNAAETFDTESANRFRVVRHRRLQLLPLATDFDEAGAFGRANPFHSSARKLPFSVHIEQAILEAGRAEVGDEDQHPKAAIA